MTRRSAGAWLLGLIVVVLAAAPIVAPNPPSTMFTDMAFAPPMPPRIVHDGRLHRPFVYPLVLKDRRERRFEEDRRRPVPIRFFSGGRIWRGAGGPDTREASTGTSAPWLLLGGDPLGRDLFARVVSGGRLSVGVAAVAVILTLAIGSLAGAAGGFAGGRLDRILMAVADFVVVLPMIYAVVTLRAAMPLVLEKTTIFWTMAVVMAAATWPLPARGVRAIVASERGKSYAEAAYAAGAGPLRILLRHLLPAARGHVLTQGLLLFPAFIFAESTLSYVGLGFAERDASWGVMLQDAGRASALIDAPWLLSPAAAIVLTVLATRLLTAGPAELEPPH